MAAGLHVSRTLSFDGGVMGGPTISACEVKVAKHEVMAVGQLRLFCAEAACAWHTRCCVVDRVCCVVDRVAAGAGRCSRHRLPAWQHVQTVSCCLDAHRHTCFGREETAAMCPCWQRVLAGN